MRFRLVIHDTDSDNKYDTHHGYELFGDRESIMFLWIELRKAGKKHVDVFNLAGMRINPEDGLDGFIDYGV